MVTRRNTRREVVEKAVEYGKEGILNGFDF
jgi:hypothetical protein